MYTCTSLLVSKRRDSVTALQLLLVQARFHWYCDYWVFVMNSAIANARK